MDVDNVEQRLNRIVAALSRISAGQYSTAEELSVGSGLVGQVEQNVNYVMMDLQTLELANLEKDASLEVQRKALSDKINTIENQSKALREREQELEAKLATIERQADAILELSVPILEIEDDIVALPIVGVVDSRRAADLMTKLLTHISAHSTQGVILDMTGVEMVDTKTADHLIRVIHAAALMGARCVLTGLSPAVVHTLVSIGVDVGQLHTLRSLKEGLRESRQQLGAGSPWAQER